MFEVNDLINEQYEVRGWAQGGMGRVYFVFDQVTHNHLVIKTIKEDFKSADACDRFEMEAKAWINLKDHPHIVRAMSFHRVPLPFLLEEFIDGPSLHELIKREPAGLSIQQAVEFAIHVLRGLHHAHTTKMPDGAVGVIHRDLKPHNILITRQSRAKIADFGLAKVAGESTPSSGNSIVGTVHYMPPEQFKGKAKQLADIYALGVTLYEMITGQLPFPRGTWYEVAHHIEKSLRGPISMLRPDVPALVGDFVYKCLRKKPSERPKSALEALRELEAIKKSLPTERVRPCAQCDYVARYEVNECPVCGPPVTFPNSGDGILTPPVVPPLPALTSWQCATCGEAVPLNYGFCLTCGSKKRAETKCFNCAADNPPDFSFCCECGTKLRGKS
ncbi:MAG: hypothetical protein FJ303_26360 [Planctomycetes bacterium]|nr:hypothetical protein [Planctomycetota bacterium]